jgi:hypothetical protein
VWNCWIEKKFNCFKELFVYENNFLRQISCWIGYGHKKLIYVQLLKNCWTNKKCLCVQNKLKPRNVVDVKIYNFIFIFWGMQSTTKQLLDMSTFDLWMILHWSKAFGPSMNASDVQFLNLRSIIYTTYMLRYIPSLIPL